MGDRHVMITISRSDELCPSCWCASMWKYLVRGMDKSGVSERVSMKCAARECAATT